MNDKKNMDNLPTTPETLSEWRLDRHWMGLEDQESDPGFFQRLEQEPHIRQQWESHEAENNEVFQPSEAWKRQLQQRLRPSERSVQDSRSQWRVSFLLQGLRPR